MRQSALPPVLLGLAGPFLFPLVATLTMPRSESVVLPLRDDLEKPPVKPAFSEDLQDRHLKQDFKPQYWRDTEPWSPGWLPEACYMEARYNELDPLEFQVVDVWYKDCAAPWTICRHSRAKENWGTILDTLSSVPVGMRQYISNLVILPGASNKGGSPGMQAAAYTRGSVLTFAPTFFKLGVLFHEITHIMDLVALEPFLRNQGYPEGTPFSHTKYWKYIYANDTSVPTPYSRASWQENFADAGRWAMTHFSRRRGLSEYSKGWRGCQAQIYGWEQWMGGKVFPRGGRCTGKVHSGKAVWVEGELQREKAEAERQRQKKEQAGLSGVQQIVIPDWAAASLFVYHR
ncbi:hypothetical protein QBC35DRAFT_40221 [Podospora australis]|uniref:Conidiation-specific protein n=1 Tax=Podospora australis TaxID=1536484 RepID=A0AAN6WMU9_9PEZI|nr:hypothetical protein QBC35DRAFT_40221 [Podospora australis]